MKFVIRLKDSEIPWFKCWHFATMHDGKKTRRARFAWQRVDALEMSEEEAREVVSYLRDNRWDAEMMQAGETGNGGTER